MTAAAVVSLRGVTKRYGRSSGASVLSGVTLEVVPGALTVVGGANGAGKSTLLRIVAGLARPSGGQVIRRHRTSGYAPASNPRLPAMSARRYLHHMGRVHGMTPAALVPRIAELCEVLDLRPGVETKMTQLSVGNFHKVMLIQAVLAPVDLLVLDEPATALDPGAVAGLRTIVEHACARGAGVLVSAHEGALDGLGRQHVLETGLVREVPSAAPGAPRPGTSPRRLVELALPDGQAGRTLGRHGVRLTSEDQGGASFSVDPSDLPVFLTEAIARGCDVVRVQPEEQA